MVSVSGAIVREAGRGSKWNEQRQRARRQSAGGVCTSSGACCAASHVATTLATTPRRKDDDDEEEECRANDTSVCVCGGTLASTLLVMATLEPRAQARYTREQSDGESMSPSRRECDALKCASCTHNENWNLKMSWPRFICTGDAIESDTRGGGRDARSQCPNRERDRVALHGLLCRRRRAGVIALLHGRALEEELP